jgi:Family of unknown function (DUF6515)
MRFRTAGIIIMAMLFTFSLTSESFAGPKKKKPKHPPKRKVVIKSRHVAKPKVFVKLPSGHKKINVKGNPYYHHAGVWYKHGASGYKIIKAPRGARITVLPVGHTIVVVGKVKYFHYYGTYYRHDLDSKEYYVVDTPVETPTTDILTLYDGDVLNGRYLGGNEEKVEFQVGDDVYEIDASEIVSIHFEPPSE